MRQNKLASLAFRKVALEFQRHELTAHFIYKKLAESTKGKNSAILKKISDFEIKHYKLWKNYTKAELKPNNWEIFHHYLLSKIFGITFAIKLLERDEQKAQKKYLGVISRIRAINRIQAGEEAQELALIRKLYEERVAYVGSIMLGLGDALVEFTGTLAGLSFALQSTKLVGLAGLIGGIAAAMSMASSEYLSKRSDETAKDPRKAALYTGAVYLITVLLLVAPNFVFKNIYPALTATLAIAVLVIVFFTYFVSVTKEVDFKKRLTETLLVSFGIAAISFAIGLALRFFLNIQV